MTSQAFNDAAAKHMETLKMYVPIVARVHGREHPEFHDVHRLFNELEKKMGAENLELAREFEELRRVTDGYTVPGDVCESYEAVYNMLSELDSAYRA